jgi:Oxidoreductase family, NAD-binding Rossmann fold
MAVAGAGIIGFAHMGTWRKRARLAHYRLSFDPVPATEAIAGKAEVPLYKSLDELFDKNRPDGVILATPNQLHLEHALKCMAAGVPQLLEKPITPTVREAETLVKEADKTGAKVLIGHHWAHSPIMARAKELIDAGRLGQLVAVMGSAVFFKPDEYFADEPWRREASGGPILLNMIHEVHKPAHAVRRYRRGASLFVSCYPRFSGRRHRRYQLAIRERSARIIHVVRHRCLRAQLGADLAREQGLCDLSRRRLLRHCRHLRFALDTDDALEDVRQGGGSLVVEAVRSQRRRDDA